MIPTRIQLIYYENLSGFKDIDSIQNKYGSYNDLCEKHSKEDGLFADKHSIIILQAYGKNNKNNIF